MLASRVLITAGTPDSMYLEDRQEKWLREEKKGRRAEEGKEVSRFGRRTVEGLRAERSLKSQDREGGQ